MHGAGCEKALVHARLGRPTPGGGGMKLPIDGAIIGGLIMFVGAAMAGPYWVPTAPGGNGRPCMV